MERSLLLLKEFRGGAGNVYFVGDMVYKTDPMIPNGANGYMINPASLDVMENQKI